MPVVEEYIERLMKDSTKESPVWNVEKLRAGKLSGWDYIDGCMLLGFLEIYRLRGNRGYFDFVKEYLDYRVSDDGTIKDYSIDAYNLDNINAGKNLLTLYEITGEAKWRLAADKLYEQIKNQPRTKEGNFWHKAIYPNQIWLDGLYMVMPFYIKYANLFMNEAERAEVYADVYRQFFNVERLMRDGETGLYYHAYDSSREMFWCNKDTGLSQNFWLRSLGWFSMAMLDSLLLLEDKESSEHKHLEAMFKDMIDSLLKFRADNGMFYQLPVYSGKGKNYLETSGSAIFAYCLKKGVKEGLLSEEYYNKGEECFKGICDTYLREENGKMHLGGICLVAGLGGKDRRDGSFDYYMSEPVVQDDAKGTAPFILAYLY
ncbi:MAG: glycoside hydrolase family 88 protein [Lachnospiraceae bacterium]|nr:glycoside hydrolase family 88 protein [Lachnospiraceae bacterium]